VYPPVSILAEPYVSWVDTNVRRRGTLDDARNYLQFLFTDSAQQIIAQMGYRPYKAAAGGSSGPPLPPMALFPITAIAHDWDDAEQRFFAENGIMDAILKEARP